MLEQSKEYLAVVKSPQRQVDARFTLNNRVYTGRQLAKLDYDQAIVSGSSYTFGGAYVAGLTVEIKELVEGLMEMMPATAEIGIVVNGKVEYKPLGQFFITDIELDRNANSTKLKLQDGFCKLNGEYQSKLSYPTSARTVFSEICQTCNISTMPMNIPDTIRLGTKLEKTSYREAIQYIAQLVGAYAIFNRIGQLEFRNIQKLSYRVNRDNYVMGGFKRKEIQFRLHGIECEVASNQKISVGSTSGNIVQMKNPWMTQMYLEELFAKVQGFTFYSYSLNFQGDPCLEVGDWIEVEFSKGEYFQAPILVEKLSFDGGLSSEISANTLGVSDVVYQYKSPLSRKVEYLEGRLSADGLSQVYSGIDEPNPTHLKKGDTWFRPNGTDIDILMWDGAKWEVRNSREKFDQLEQEFQEQEKYFDELKKKFEAQDKYFKELDAEFENSKQILDSAKADLDNAKIELETNKQSISANEQLIQQSNEEMVEMRKKFNTIDNSISNFNESIRAHELSLTNLDDSVSTMNKTLANANNTLAGIENNYVKTAEYTRDTTNLKSRLTSVEGYGTKISSLEQTVNGFKTEVADKNKDQDSKYSSLEQTVGNFKTTINSFSNDQGTMKNRISALEQTDSTFKSSIAAAEKRIDTILRDGSNIISDDPVFGSYMNNVTKDGKRAKITCNPRGAASFYIQAKQSMTSGMSYSVSFDCSGVQTGDELFFYIEGHGDENKLVKLKNGRNTQRLIRYSDGVLIFFSHASEKSKFSGTRNLILDNFEIHSMGLANAITLTHSNIIQAADSIRNEVTQKVSGIDGKITTLSNTVTQTANSWAVKNIKNNNDIVSQINLTDDNVYIKGKNIWLDGTTRIEDAIIKTAHIQNGTITNAKIGDAAITTVKIENSSITSSKILDATITSAKIGYAQINGAHIQSASITNSKIATAAIGSAEIMDGAIINAKIANAAITDAKIQNGTITNASIRDATITSAKIAYIDAAKITTGTMSADRIYGGVLNAQNGAMRINLNSADIEFNYSSSINFKSGSNAIKRIRNGCTGFLHFNDDAYGGVYVGLGVTSSNEGLNSQNTSRFAGVRIFRPNDNVDKVEMYGDEITFSHAFGPNAHALIMDPLKFSRNFTMSEIINSISSLWRCWQHLNNVYWDTKNDNFGTAVFNELNAHGL